VRRICQSEGKTTRLTVLVPVTVSALHTVIILLHSIETTQALTLAIVVSEACQSSIHHITKVFQSLSTTNFSTEFTAHLNNFQVHPVAISQLNATAVVEALLQVARYAE
jgi:phosphoribosyl-AMP cyclohydrolase